MAPSHQKALPKDGFFSWFLPFFNFNFLGFQLGRSDLWAPVSKKNCCEKRPNGTDPKVGDSAAWCCFILPTY